MIALRHVVANDGRLVLTVAASIREKKEEFGYNIHKNQYFQSELQCDRALP